MSEPEVTWAVNDVEGKPLLSRYRKVVARVDSDGEVRYAIQKRRWWGWSTVTFMPIGLAKATTALSEINREDAR